MMIFAAVKGVCESGFIVVECPGIQRQVSDDSVVFFQFSDRVEDKLHKVLLLTT